MSTKQPKLICMDEMDMFLHQPYYTVTITLGYTKVGEQKHKPCKRKKERKKS